PLPLLLLLLLHGVVEDRDVGAAAGTARGASATGSSARHSPSARHRKWSGPDTRCTERTLPTHMYCGRNISRLTPVSAAKPVSRLGRFGAFVQSSENSITGP